MVDFVKFLILLAVTVLIFLSIGIIVFASPEFSTFGLSIIQLLGVRRKVEELAQKQDLALIWKKLRIIKSKIKVL